MKFGVYGSGLVGCYVGGRLLEAGHSVHFLGRKGVLEPIQQQGLTLSRQSQNPITLPTEKIKWSESSDDLVSCEVIFVTVKSHQTASVALELKRKIKPSTLIVSLQN